MFPTDQYEIEKSYISFILKNRKDCCIVCGKEVGPKSVYSIDFIDHSCFFRGCNICLSKTQIIKTIKNKIQKVWTKQTFGLHYRNKKD